MSDKEPLDEVRDTEEETKLVESTAEVVESEEYSQAVEDAGGFRHVESDQEIRGLRTHMVIADEASGMPEAEEKADEKDKLRAEDDGFLGVQVAIAVQVPQRDTCTVVIPQGLPGVAKYPTIVEPYAVAFAGTCHKCI